MMMIIISSSSIGASLRVHFHSDDDLQDNGYPTSNDNEDEDEDHSTLWMASMHSWLITYAQYDGMVEKLKADPSYFFLCCSCSVLS